MKRFLLTLLIFTAFLQSCSAAKNGGKSSESSGVQTIFEKPVTVRAKSVGEIFADIQKRKKDYRFYSKGGDLKSMSNFIFGTDSKLSKNLSEGTYVQNIPVVVYKGSFDIHAGDWEVLSDALKVAGDKIRVTLDFSECKMEIMFQSDESKYQIVPSGVFTGVPSLAEIHFPENITAIGSRSFSDCANLRAVFFPKNTVVHSLGYDSFNDNPSLEDVHIYHFDGALDECFYQSGVKSADASEREFGTISTVEMPNHPIYLEGYGAGYYQYVFGKTKVGKIVTPSRTFSLDEWVDWCRPMKPKTGVVKEAVSTSELDAASGKYKASNVANAHWTSWVEGSAGDGSGEMLTLTLKEPTTLSYLCIKNGFGNLAYYWANNRAKEITVILDDDEKTAEKHTLSDTPLAQYIHLQKYDKLYSKITLKIESVYKGTDAANDCAIDEIGVNAGISRREVYGGYYDTESVSYVYDGEIQRMLKGLYSLDVGAGNVRVSKEGFVQVQATDWETGNRYWATPSGAFSGTLYNGFFPGTGGGHSYDKFHIYLNPNGNHFLFTWHDESYGVFEIRPSNLKIYSWQNKEWKRQTKENHASALNEIFDTLSFVQKKNLSYRFYIGESDNDSVKITLYPKNGALNLPVPLAFAYDEKSGVFLPYFKTVLTELAFGSPDSLKSLGDWKEQYEKNEANAYHQIHIFCYPACFNQNASMIRFLNENGFTVENTYKTEKGREEPYEITALQAWKAGGNTDEVRAALIKAGAEYSPEMLAVAIDQGDTASFTEYAPLVKDYEKVLEHLEGKIGSIPAEKQKVYFKTLHDLGVDLNAKTGHENRYLLMNTAIRAYDIDLVKFFLSLGVAIPKLDDYFGQTPLEVMAQKYIESSKSRDNVRADGDEYYAKKYDDEAKAARKMLDFLFSIGLSADEKDGSGGNMLHDIANEHRRINAASLEMAKLFVSHGADVNQVGKYGTPLSILIEKSDWDERDWNRYQTEFKNLLLEKGAYSEYAVMALLKRFEAKDLLNKNATLKDKFDFYLSKCTGRLVATDSRDHPQRNKTKSLIVHFLEQCYSRNDDGEGDEMILRLLDAGFGLEGMVDYNGENDPILFYADVKNKWNLSGKKGEVVKRFLSMRPESAIPLDKMLYNVIREAIKWAGNDNYFAQAKFLIENGASWQYTQNEKINGVSVKNTAWLLLAIDEDCFDFGPYEYNEVAFYDDDYKPKFEPKKMTKDELEYFDERATPYIETATLLIEKGAGEILTEKAFKKAKVPERVYKRIFE